MKASDWIDLVKARHGWASDYRVAQAIGRTKATVSAYRIRPDATMDDATCIEVANLLDQPAGLVILDQVAERTKSPEAREALLQLLRYLQNIGYTDTAPGHPNSRARPAPLPGRRRLDAVAPLLQQRHTH